MDRRSQKHDILEMHAHEERALRWHEVCRGKLEMFPKCPVRGNADFAVWYTPGVAEPCRRIAKDPDTVWSYTNRGNTVAVLSDGSRVLGLGDIGPLAGLPVMEGKGLIFKMYGGVDAFPLCVNTPDTEAMVAVARAIAPSFGGINLEDIASPRCFDILDRLREELDIFVWHDDRQGTATVILAGLLNALALTGRRLEESRIVLVGAGAANLAVAELLQFAGIDLGHVIFVDKMGILGPEQVPWHPVRDRLVAISNGDCRHGGLCEAMRGADVVIALSAPGPGIITSEMIASMAPDPIVFACANPVPEIWPQEAYNAGAAVVATGRGDFANQMNNALIFPGVFRGALDVQARTITQGMCWAAARALAQLAQENLRADAILPPLTHPLVAPTVALAVAQNAIAERVACRFVEPMEIFANTQTICSRNQKIMQKMVEESWVPVLD